MINKLFTRREILKLSAISLGGSMFFSPSIFSKWKSISKITRSTFTMGSIVNIEAYCENKSMCHHAIDEAFIEMRTIDKLMSIFDDHSQVSKINRLGGKERVHVDHRVIEVIKHAKFYSDLTTGEFDITIEPLMKAYGFRKQYSNVDEISDDNISDVLGAIGSKYIIIDENDSTIFLSNPKTNIDLGGIAVGYAIDRAVVILKSYGVESALINHSGDAYAMGSPPYEERWLIGIINPKNTDEIIETIGIKDRALSTSGNYENKIFHNGKIVGHLLNPKTGLPAQKYMSFTTTASTSLEADVLSTGLFVANRKNSIKFLNQHKDVTIFAIDGDGEIIKKPSELLKY
ncbi:MAG: FAD:protein FMN transferase [Bacteroidota bacterium]|nr:FAD:protein FMN transferase [Bacteroidota bacterium]